MKRSSIRNLIVAVAVAFVTGGSAAVIAQREPMALSQLENLRTLDVLPRDAGVAATTCASVFTVVNERWLGYLPTMETLRVEDAIAGVALRVSGWPAAHDDDDDRVARARVERLASAHYSFEVIAGEAVGFGAGRLLALSGLPVASALSDRVTGQ